MAVRSCVTELLTPMSANNLYDFLVEPSVTWHYRDKKIYVSLVWPECLPCSVINYIPKDTFKRDTT